MSHASQHGQSQTHNKHTLQAAPDDGAASIGKRTPTRAHAAELDRASRVKAVKGDRA